MALAQLLAVQQFVQSLGPDDAATAQAKALHMPHLLQSIANSIDASTCVEFLSHVNAQSVWTMEEKKSLSDAVTEALRGGSPGSPTRRAPQDYTEFPNYVPPSLWRSLTCREGSATQKLGRLCQFLCQLGLRSASEATCQLVTALLLHLPGNETLLSAEGSDHQAHAPGRLSRGCLRTPLSCALSG